MSKLPTLAHTAYRHDKHWRLFTAISGRMNALNTQSDINQRVYGLPESPQWALLRHTFLKLKRDISNNVVNNKTEQHYHEVKRRFERITGKMNTEEQSRALFGHYRKKNSNNQCPIGKIFLRNLQEATRRARKEELVRRTAYAMAEAHEKGHYIVFNTLTVRPEQMETVFKDGTEWSKFIKKLNRDCGAKSEYIAVTEEGTKTGRLHIHIIHTLEHLPAGCYDPNIGRKNPTHREIPGLKEYWPHGYSAPVAVRLSHKDAYAKAGWRWPAVIKNEKVFAQQPKPPEALAEYLGKYITKTYTQPTKTRAYKWRTKMTQQIGMTPVKMILRKMTSRQLVQIINCPTTRQIRMRNKPIPKKMLQTLAMKIWMSRAMNKAKWKSLVQTTPQPSITKQWQNLTQMRTDHNSLNIMYTGTLRWISSATYKKLLRVIQETADTTMGRNDRALAWGGSLQ